MSLLEKAKQIVKESKAQKKPSRSPMDQLLSDPEVKKTARYLAKHMSLSAAREKLNDLLEEEGKLPVRKNGKVARITYARFKELLPKPRKNNEA